jgi:phosphohistidine phosphatase
MMELYVLRHGIAVQRGTPAYIRNDSERPLTGKGIKRMRRGTRGMRQLGVAFDVLLTSPYRRARETAQIVADSYEVPDLVETFEPLSAEVAPEETIRELARRCKNLYSVLLVGHEPQLSSIGSLLLGGRSDLALDLKKGGLFKLWLEHVEPGRAALEWWLTPRQLRDFARSDR